MDNERLDLARYRLEKARNCLSVAELSLNSGFYADSANRSYYAVFHSARAVMALDGADRKKHSGVISYFQENYIRTKIFDAELSEIIQDAFQVRQTSDYQDFFVIGRDDAEKQLADARRFCADIEKYVHSFG